jgi:hypothetical protein
LLLFIATMAAMAGDSMRSFDFGAVGAAPAAPWEPLDLPKKITRANARVVADEGQAALEVETAASAGGAIVRMSPTVATGAHLAWHWKVDRVVSAADLASKAGDDFAARVYVMFDYPIEKLPFAERVKARIARVFYDKPLPLATLCYVWDNTHPHETIVPSAYTDRVRLIVLRNGADPSGVWTSESRDLDADFRSAFGEPAPPIIGIAYATDTDNTGAAATAWFEAPILR